LADKRWRGKTTVIPHQFCPACLAPLNRASHPTARVGPKPGDLNVCIHCAAVMMYGDDLTLRALDAKEQLSLSVVDPKAWADVQKFRAIIREMPKQSHDRKTRQ
jgi:hypothetical protein